MWIWLLTFPVAMFTLVFGLAILEARVLSPSERTDRIRRLLETESADVVEAGVGTLLAAVVQARV